MVSMDCDTTTTGGVTLVTLRLESEGPTHVRIEHRMEGPLWPPRRQGVPAAGWDDEGFEGVVDGHLAVGYATPTEPGGDEPPAAVVETHPPTDDESLSAEALVREFGPGTPPRDAVDPGPESPSRDAPGGTEPPPAAAPVGDDGRGTSQPENRPPGVTAWLDSVAERLDSAEKLAAATSLEGATEAVADAGGAGEVQSLQDQLVADRRALRRVARQCEELADRAEAVEVPVETLSRLA